MARRLVTLKDDVEIEFDPEACKFTGLNTASLRHYAMTLGFTSLVNRLPAEAKDQEVLVARHNRRWIYEEGLFGAMPAGHGCTPPRSQRFPVAAPADDEGLATGVSCKYTLIHTDEQFDEFLAELKKQKRFAFDTETDALGAMNSNLVGMSFSWEPETGYYVPVCGPEGSQILPCEKTLAALKPILEDPHITKVGHNIKYDILVMRNAGVEVRGVVLDSMVGAWLVESSRMHYGIDRLALDLHFKKIPNVRSDRQRQEPDIDGQGRAGQESPATPPRMRTSPGALAALVDRKLDAIPASAKAERRSGNAVD